MPQRPVFHPPSAEGFRIDDLLLPWGTTHAALRQALAARVDADAGPSGGDLLRCADACGFAAIALECGPGSERQPLRVLTWQLAPYDPKRPVADPRHWTDAIVAALGPPQDVQEADAEEREGAGEGTVLYYANWESGDWSVGLSVFGGQRPETHGVSAAYLYLSWNDTDSAARALLPQVQQRQQRVDAISGGGVEWIRQQLQYEINPICSAEDAASRLLERALSDGPHCDTPKAWAGRLGDKDVAFWRRSDGSAWGLCSRHDTLLFERGQTDVEVNWHNRLPNRFGGQMELDIGGLHLMDQHSSKALTALATEIGRSLGRRLECTESEDNG